MYKKSEVRIIEVLEYNPDWKAEFIKEAKDIYKIMGKEVVKVHHIGSTSIPGIDAKPVIDILVEVKNIENVDLYNESLKSLGYIAKGEYCIPNRRFFLKGIYKRTHHIHVFESGNSEIKRHINFRDYMIQHPEEAKQYAELKKELAKTFRYDIEGYCNGKDAFVKGIDKKAYEWAKLKDREM
ncbi:GrpB family protein [Paraclostridium ghonii]|uniref:GrpB-like predicted nucleotidyltransferase (UPF0157 family) n=1 Tax=Paraclostridium ghonii TaxID=29358 RepID=A0ABU0MY29_9FIRM|nr:GrpB family protein [Paeniclostridium ghonii]MDQ0555755.1 GrpB-like predicted nucleotidyltransferase (UPF0157 family) [Paeniclostridium ghonii]